MWRSLRVALVVLGSIQAGHARGEPFPEPIDHLTVMKDLLVMPKPRNCQEAATSLDMQICSAHAFREADAVLNKAYQAAIKEQSEAGRAKLRSAERAWLVYRDADCAWQASLYEGGTLAPVTYGQCLVDLTRARIKAIDTAKLP